MGCQKWLRLCAPNFLTYFWQYRWCGQLQCAVAVVKYQIIRYFFQFSSFCTEELLSTDYSTWVYNFGYIAGTKKTVFVSQLMKLETFTHFIEVFGKISVVFLLYFCPTGRRREYKWLSQKVSNKRGRTYRLEKYLVT